MCSITQKSVVKIQDSESAQTVYICSEQFLKKRQPRRNHATLFKLVSTKD